MWRLWKNNRTKGELETENQDKVCKKPSVSEEVQQLVLNCYDCFGKSMLAKYGSITETTKALKLPKTTIERIIEKGGVKSMEDEKIKRKLDFRKNLIWHTVYGIYRKKLPQRWISFLQASRDFS